MNAGTSSSVASTNPRGLLGRCEPLGECGSGSRPVSSREAGRTPMVCRPGSTMPSMFLPLAGFSLFARLLDALIVLGGPVD